MVYYALTHSSQGRGGNDSTLPLASSSDTAHLSRAPLLYISGKHLSSSDNNEDIYRPYYSSGSSASLTISEACYNLLADTY